MGTRKGGRGIDRNRIISRGGCHRANLGRSSRATEDTDQDRGCTDQLRDDALVLILYTLLTSVFGTLSREMAALVPRHAVLN